MPRLRPRSFLSPLILVAALVLFSASMLLAQPMTNPNADPAKAPRTMTWVLSNGTVINPGKTEGNLTTGYVVEATATATGPARIITGKFTIKCNIQDQGNGKQRLQGVWVITREGAAKQIKRTSNSIKGTLVANLDFNPVASINQAAGSGAINGQVRVSPKRRHAGKEIKAEGTFAGDEKFNGTLSISRK
jgi:hypothetical protein